MSADDDKTVFKQPVPGGERTVMRPTPGGRSAGNQPPPSGGNVPPHGRPSAPIRASSADTGAAYFRTDTGLNPLVNAASTLIAVFEKTRQSMNHPDVGGLHQRLVSEIKAFEARTREQGIRQEVILSARYLMCSVLDEAVLNTPWGSESAWAQRTLLTVFHSETSGGEKSFLILDRMRQTPADNRDFLELFYICLCLGFEGKYRLMNRGRDALDQMKEELFAMIRRHRGEYERALSSHWAGLGNAKNSLTEYVPMWVVVSLVLVILFFSYTGFRYWLHNSATPVAEQLIDISAEQSQQ